MSLYLTQHPQDQKNCRLFKKAIRNKKTANNKTITPIPNTIFVNISPTHFQQYSENETKKSLRTNTAKEMIQRLLTEKKIPTKKLAKLLSITIRDLENLSIKQGSTRLMSKVSLPLVKLYCKTRWNRKKTNPYYPNLG